MTCFDLAGAWLSALRPPLRVAPSVFAERELRLPATVSSRPGPVRLTAAQKGIVDAISAPEVRKAVLMTSVQVGKSLTLATLIAHAACMEGGQAILIRPTDSDAESWVKEVLDPLIEASPALRAVIGAGAKDRDNKRAKSGKGFSLAVASAWKPADLASRACRWVLGDEVDRWPLTVGPEGSPLDIAAKRATTFLDHKIVWASTPTLTASSRIYEEFQKGDQRKLNVFCPDCGAAFPLDHTCVVIDEGKIVCPHCAHRIDEATRQRLLESAEWVATCEPAETGTISFHMGEIASPFSSIDRVCEQIEAAKSHFERQKTLHNLCFGLPFQQTTEAEVDSSDLMARAVKIQPPYSKQVEHVTCGVDVQGNRLEVLFTAFGANAQKWILDRVVLSGDSSGAAVWQQLQALLTTKTFLLEDRRTLPLSMTFIDAGFATEQVVSFVASARAKGLRIWPTLGRAGWHLPSVKEGAKLKNRMRGIIVGVDNLKLAALKGLAIHDPKENGHVNLPDHLESDFYEGLTAERLEIRAARNGFSKMTWVKSPSIRNEPLDIFVLCLAAASLLKGRAAPVNAKPQPSIADRVRALYELHNSIR